MAQNQFKCSGNCISCTPIQRQYCSSQLAYNSMRMIEVMQGAIEDLKAKIDAIQNSEASVFDPTNPTKPSEKDKDTAQNG